MRLILSTLLTLLLLTCAALAQADEVFETVLPNGLKVILKENHNAPVINFNVAYRVGSKHERPGITGIAHLLEHMMFKSTVHNPQGHFDSTLQAVGADNNANTWLDRTIYWSTISSDEIDTALELEAERMRELAFIPEEHRLEMPVVRNELEQRNDSPFTLLFEELLSIAFKAHPYNIPTIGWVDDVEGILTSDIEEFYHRWYHPDNAFVVAVGDFNTPEMLARIEEHFGHIPAGGVSQPRLPQEPTQLGERRFVLKRAGQVDYVLTGWKTPNSSHPDAYALVVLGNILGQGRTSRLYRALVDTGMAAEAFSWADSFNYADPFLFFTGAVVAPGNAPADIEQAIYDQIELIKTGAVGANELERAKKQARASFVYNRDSIVSEAQALMDFELYSNDWRGLYSYLPGIEQVTAEDVQRVAQTYLHDDNRTVGYYLAQPPGADATPAEVAMAGRSAIHPPHYRADCAVCVRGVGHSKEFSAPVGRLGAAASGGVSIAQSSEEGPYAEVFTLANGLTIAVRENRGNPSVSLSGVVPAGGMNDPADMPGLANLVVSMLDRGTEQYTKAQLAELAEDNAVSLGFGSGRESFTFRGRSLTEDFPLLLDLLAAELLTPTFPQNELDLLRAEVLTTIRENDIDTTAQAGRRARALLYGENAPFARPIEGTEESVTAATRDDLQRWYDTHVVPQGTIITIVGDVDAAAARAALEQRFGSWTGTAAGREALIASGAAFNPVGGQVERVQLPEKSNVTLLWAGPGPDKLGDDWPARVVANYILGGDFSARLMRRLRVAEGLTYGSYSYYSNGAAAGPWFAVADVNPTNIDRAIEVMNEELGRYAAEGPTEEELETAKSFITGNFPVRLSTNSAVAGTLTDALYLGKGVDYIQRYPEMVRAVTMEQVRAAINDYLNPANLLLVQSGTLP